jgi:sn-glycerol 3-phosphate transport system substrate-binding protein
MYPRLFPVALLAAVAMALSACGSGGSPTADPLAAPGPSALAGADGPVVVTLWHGQGGPAGKALDAQVAVFNAANRGRIEVKAAYQGSYTDTLAKYTAAIRDDGTPSVLIINDITSGYVRDAGQTIPAQAMAQANPGDLDLDQLRPAARNYYTAQGQLLAVPFATSMPLLYVNDEILDRAGVDRSTLGSLDGVAAAARAIKAKQPRVAGVVQPFDGWWFEQLTAAAGQNYCTPGNGREPGGATAVAFTAQTRQAIATMAKVYTDGAGLDTGTDGATAVKAFTEGKAAMMLNSSGAIGPITEAEMKGWSTLPYPLSGARATSGALIGGTAMWVSGPGHTPAEQVASWKAISFLASAKAQEPFAQVSGYAPVNTTVDTSPTDQAFLAKNPNYLTLRKQFADTPVVPATAGCLTGAMPGIRDEVVSRMQAAFTGDVPIDTALTEAEEAAGKKVVDYRRQAGQ